MNRRTRKSSRKRMESRVRHYDKQMPGYYLVYAEPVPKNATKRQLAALRTEQKANRSKVREEILWKAAESGRTQRQEQKRIRKLRLVKARRSTRVVTRALKRLLRRKANHA